MASVAYEEVLALFRETDRQMKETDLKMQETDRMIKELGKQIGGLGEKFGGFTEGMAFASMQRILREQFLMENIHTRVMSRKQGREMEIDVLAWANSDVNRVFIVEVKSHPRPESITQTIKLLDNFRFFYPEHTEKMLSGILAGVDWTNEMRQQTLAAGLYVAAIHDDIFAIETPQDFTPKAW